MSSLEEREKARHRLQELAESATPAAAADSSGYVDLSAYSASDADWVEHALARSKSGDVASPARTVDSRALGSVAPLEVPTVTEAPQAVHHLSRRRTVGVVSAILAGATAVLLLVVLHPLASHRSGVVADRAGATQAAVTPPSVTTGPATAPPIPVMQPSTATASAAPAESKAGGASATAATPVARPRVPVTAAPARPRAPSRPASPSIPKNKPGGGDALTNAILQSIAAPPASKK
jgi:hypothetical protein